MSCVECSEPDTVGNFIMGMQKAQRDRYTFNALLLALCKSNHLREAEKLLERMREARRKISLGLEESSRVGRAEEGLWGGSNIVSKQVTPERTKEQAALFFGVIFNRVCTYYQYVLFIIIIC